MDSGKAHKEGAVQYRNLSSVQDTDFQVWALFDHIRWYATDAGKHHID